MCFGSSSTTPRHAPLRGMVGVAWHGLAWPGLAQPGTSFDIQTEGSPTGWLAANHNTINTGAPAKWTAAQPFFLHAKLFGHVNLEGTELFRGG